MSKRYTTEFKDAVIKKMMPPYPTSVSQLCRETGVSGVTLYKWKKDYQNQGVAVPAKKKKSEIWSAEDKLATIIESASFNEIQLSEYCRRKGLYKERWIQVISATRLPVKTSSGVSPFKTFLGVKFNNRTPLSIFS
ncbi:transposase [Desulforhopalus vacuolatus]|uniref:transposase n=1 Tax=Desulforhopalus vacuolatus TaxID=40414 RepID=UPI001964F3EE|nr:transposase [Desulforhopalus vacuolatus]MBM9521247.1 transposase [Desulforhopalus vacuolatus]